MNLQKTRLIWFPFILLTTVALCNDISAHEFLTGYKVIVMTRVYEDGSLSVHYELNMDPDATETISHKRMIFKSNRYELTEQNIDNAYIMTATKTFSPSSQNGVWTDDLAERHVICRGDTFYYHEIFFNFLIHDEIAGSNLKNDTATAKVLMADTDYQFNTILPGLALESSTGQTLKDTVQWQYDIEQLFDKHTIMMSAAGVIDRDEDVGGAILMISVFIMMIAALLWIRNKVIRRTADSGSPAL